MLTSIQGGEGGGSNLPTHGLAVISKEWMLSQCSTIIAPLQVVNDVAGGQRGFIAAAGDNTERTQ